MCEYHAVFALMYETTYLYVSPVQLSLLHLENLHYNYITAACRKGVGGSSECNKYSILYIHVKQK